MKNTRVDNGECISNVASYSNSSPKEITKAAEKLAAQSHDTWDKIEVRYTTSQDLPNEDVEVRVSRTRKFVWHLFKHLGITITCERANVYRITE